DELVGAGLAYGEMMAFEVAPGPFTTKITTAGSPDAALFTSDFVGDPQAVTFAAIVATNLANAFLVFSTTTEMNMADYLTFAKENDANGIGLAVEALESTVLFEELKGEGPFTLFIPIDEGMQAIPETVKLDIEKVLRGHVVPGYWPAYLLDGQTSLTNLNGDELTITYPENDWWQLNGLFSIYNHTRVSNGVVYPVEGLIVPGE
ncbi:MAG TPA: fasciclin domain-containing protein, partial [Aggregatilineaceae bacterium]|nr:fasciclin domain-containing protein [Aggregatilineaceae bacterium]